MFLGEFWGKLVIYLIVKLILERVDGTWPTGVI